MLFSLVASLFSDVRIYAFPNAGGWYDTGYVLGVCLSYAGTCGGAEYPHWKYRAIKRM